MIKYNQEYIKGLMISSFFGFILMIIIAFVEPSPLEIATTAGVYLLAAVAYYLMEARGE